jgi:hypothetical protein
MSTISVAVARAGGYSPRHNISGHQWTEAAIANAGGLAIEPLIGSFDQVLDVKTWAPDQDDEEVLHGHPVQANIEALNSEELEVLYDEGTDFDTGTHSDTAAVGNDLMLKTSPFEEDWEGVSPLDDWSTRLPTGGGSFSIITDGDSKVLYVINWNDQQLFTPDNGPFSSDVEMRTDIKFNTANTNGVAGPAARITGSGSATRGYFLELRYNTDWIRFNRITGDGTWTYINHHVGPKFIATGTWYTIMFKASGTSFYYKIWATDTESEPGSWTWIGSDSTHAGPGDTGIFTKSGSGNENFHFDNYRAEAVPPTYASSGNWESGILDLTSVDHYSHGFVTWDEVVPTNTTLAVKVRWPDEVAWTALTNGAVLPTIEYENDMRAGSTFNSFELRVEMATTESSATPELANLRVYFEPCRQEELEIVVDGVSCVSDDNSLLNWGRGLIGTSGNPPTLEADWSDLYSETNYPWMSRDLETITATLKYWSNTIEAITFEAEASKYRLGYQRSYWSVPLTPFFSGPTLCSYTTLTSWWPIQKVYEWIIIDKGQAIHADGKYVVGHYQRDFLPGSLLVGTVNRRYNPGSLLVEGYLRNINPGSLLVQGPRRDIQPGMVIVAEPYSSLQPGSFLVGVEHLSANPGSFLIYGVNRDGSIFVNVIDDNTYQTLLDLGVTFS